MITALQNLIRRSLIERTQRPTEAKCEENDHLVANHHPDAERWSSRALSKTLKAGRRRILFRQLQHTRTIFMLHFRESSRARRLDPIGTLNSVSEPSPGRALIPAFPS